MLKLTSYEFICIPAIASVTLYFFHDTIITTQTLGSERIRYIDEITLTGIIKCSTHKTHTHTHYTYEHIDDTRKETLDTKSTGGLVITKRNIAHKLAHAHTHTHANSFIFV